MSLEARWKKENSVRIYIMKGPNKWAFSCKPISDAGLLIAAFSLCSAFFYLVNARLFRTLSGRSLLYGGCFDVQGFCPSLILSLHKGLL